MAEVQVGGQRKALSGLRANGKALSGLTNAGSAMPQVHQLAFGHTS